MGQKAQRRYAKACCTRIKKYFSKPGMGQMQKPEGRQQRAQAREGNTGYYIKENAIVLEVSLNHGYATKKNLQQPLPRGVRARAEYAAQDAGERSVRVQMVRRGSAGMEGGAGGSH